MPGVKDESPRAWDYGPSLIVERRGMGFLQTTAYRPDNADIWLWLEALLRIGVHVMSDDDLAAMLPEELRKYWEDGK
jgi:hypothetical protein